MSRGEGQNERIFFKLARLIMFLLHHLRILGMFFFFFQLLLVLLALLLVIDCVWVLMKHLKSMTLLVAESTLNYP